MNFPRENVVNEKNRRVVMQLDLAAFEKIEGILENHGLAKHMERAADDKSFRLEEARAFYSAENRL